MVPHLSVYPVYLWSTAGGVIEVSEEDIMLAVREVLRAYFPVHGETELLDYQIEIIAQEVTASLHRRCAA